MIDTKQFLSAIRQIAEEKGIAEASILETIEAALAAAYKRDYGKKGQVIKVKLNVDSGEMEVTQTHYVVEGFDEEGYITGPLPQPVAEERPEPQESSQRRRESLETPAETSHVTESGELKIKFNPEKHLTVEEARKIKRDAKVGDEIVTKLEPKTEFGRIAAQTAKQVVIQRLREAEREAVFAEFKEREGKIISGVIQRREGVLVFVDIGKTTGLLAPAEQLPADSYNIGQRFRFLVLRVEETSRGPAILLSRAHPKLVIELFRVEVPEIDSGAVEIKGVAREPGSRTKIAVASKEEGVDPIGSLVGQKGVRVQTVINELSGEKIDIILWDERPKQFIANSLSPAKTLDVKLVDEERHIALVEVSEDQFSLAIGKRGQNVRLAAKLTGWRIDVRSPKEAMIADPVEEQSTPEQSEGKEEKTE